ncbi:hypothetical protein THERMOS_580 [Bathymodiolus thermophilus thioautotrophic gill symbiont]|uniref:Uncharacterized protein n=2 Tax=Bathymodiolus thermophilus thioautotrophic gill symbiont TaxID=2360 RepID=A0A1J5U877_9GAMM|nr:hypothetical protein BGC33_03925 [Bathymodiolus thermophilus thioautotrophic gill symbiont]CAB5496881.1 hypothetical protein THERMOS_580 [Bathymodiolus thermophilus thioautotrophic gill symbiont]
MFSDFDSLLEVAFALNVSYHLIPNLHNLGKKKIDEMELRKITEWQVKIEESTSEKKVMYKVYIETIKSSSDEDTNWKITSKVFNSYIATVFAILTVIILFLSATKWKFLEVSQSYQVAVVVALLLPNVISIFCQVMHWQKIRKTLKRLIKKLEK